MLICEIGLNHMGDIPYANEYIKKIIDSKSNAALFHIREESFYKSESGKKFLLTNDFYKKTSEKLKINGLKFGITLADPTKIDFFEKINTDFYKIFSRDILDKELLTCLKKTKKPIFVSTGMSNFREIKKMIDYIGQSKKNFHLIHTQLDNDAKYVNLKVIPSLNKKFHMPIAYGNHCKNTNVIFLSLAFEPSAIFFYVKGNKFSKHVDNAHAVKLEQLKSFIKNIQELKESIGKSVKLKMQSNIH